MAMKRLVFDDEPVRDVEFWGLLSVQRVITGRAQSFYSGAPTCDDPMRFGDLLVGSQNCAVVHESMLPLSRLQGCGIAIGQPVILWHRGLSCRDTLTRGKPIGLFSRNSAY
jgi:hypothetical protein